MKWAGHLVRMKDEILPKDLRQRNKAVAENEEGAAKMGGLSEERLKKGRRVKRNANKGSNEKITKVAVQRVHE